MSNYRYSEYKKLEVRQENIPKQWTENKVWEKWKKYLCALGVYSETDDIADWKAFGL